MNVIPVELENEYVRLEPMTTAHIGGLVEAGSDAEIWQWTLDSYYLTPEKAAKSVADCLERQRNGQQIPFVIIDKRSEEIVGSTSYLNIFPSQKDIEIGYTFINPRVQRSHVNRSCKYLLLQHAFERLGANRVALQTHHQNQRSRNAILGIGAKLDGILRNNKIMPDGSLRSSAMYSILKEEWPDVKLRLELKVNQSLELKVEQHVPA